MVKLKRYLIIAAGALLLGGCNIFQSDSSDPSVQSVQKTPAMVLAKTAAEPAGTECIEPPEGLIGFWPGDGTAKDYSGYYNHGALMGNATYSEGYVQQAFKTDPVGDYVDISNSAVYDSLSAVTLSAWIFVVENIYYPAIINKGNVETADESFSLFLDPWGKLGVLLNSNGTGSGRTMYVGPRIPANEWYFVTATYDGLWVKIYLDGALIGSKVHFGGIHTGGNNIILGVMEKNTDLGASPSISGNIDETSIYNRALSDNEILALYNAGHYGKCKDPSKIDPPPPPPPELTPEQKIEKAEEAIQEAKDSLISLKAAYWDTREAISNTLKTALTEAKKEKDVKLRRELVVEAVKTARQDMREARTEVYAANRALRTEIRNNRMAILNAKKEIEKAQRASRKSTKKAKTAG